MLQVLLMHMPRVMLMVRHQVQLRNNLKLTINLCKTSLRAGFLIFL
jgi:hypothetical protein